MAIIEQPPDNQMTTVGGVKAVKVDVVQTTGAGGAGSLSTATKGTTAAGNPTSATTDANTQALHVNVTNFPASQPVTLATAPTTPVTGTFWQATQPVSLATVPTTPVTGTFWQATQPVSGTVTANAGTGTMAVSLATAPTTPVTGTFFQATQPVSAVSLPLPTGAAADATLTGGTQLSKVQTPVKGTTAAGVVTSQTTDANTQALHTHVTNFPATQAVSLATAPTTPVTGTFWQTTQPVSLATAPTTPVTGTFFQATQPVSAASLPLPTGAALDATLTGGTQLAKIQTPAKGTTVAGVVTSQTTDANTQALHAHVTNFPATQAVSLATAPTTPVTGTFWQATQPVSGTVALGAGAASVGTVILGAGAATVGTINQAAITKGTQGATGVTTQDLKDAGRSNIMLFWDRAAGTAAAESALTNFTAGNKAGAAITPATSYTVTSGKTLRIQSIHIALTATSTISNNGKFRLRQAASAIANTSQIIWSYDMPWGQTGVVSAGVGISDNIAFPDGLEIPAGQQLTFTWFTAATTCSVSITISGYEY